MNMPKNNPLKELVKEGCFALTGADPFILKTVMKYVQKQNGYFICEASVNQVNQFGGYTGMNPYEYAVMIQDIAKEIGFPVSKIILSGDHLGPFIWKNLDSETAMNYSGELVRQYVAAGFRKIHLDTTMPLKSDSDGNFNDSIIAKRAAELAKIAEEEYEKTKNDTPWSYRPAYVIGSEVPAPGGTEEKEGIHITKPEDLSAAIISFQDAFLHENLPQVCEDIVAVVAQIGIEFSDMEVHDYNHDAMILLKEELRKYPNIRFESHSSDYQTSEALRNMVQDGVGILKVGPETTFKYREGLFALAKIEEELADLNSYEKSDFINILENVMVNTKPNYWEKYYNGNEKEKFLKRKYSFSDRSRYYLSQPLVQTAIVRLIKNLSEVEVPLTLLSQYLPQQYEKIRNNEIVNNPVQILEDKIINVVDRYYRTVIDFKRNR